MGLILALSRTKQEALFSVFSKTGILFAVRVLFGFLVVVDRGKFVVKEIGYAVELLVVLYRCKIGVSVFVRLGAQDYIFISRFLALFVERNESVIYVLPYLCLLYTSASRHGRTARRPSCAARA